MNGKRICGFCVAASALALPAQIELVAPASNAVVRQLHTIQRRYAKAPWAECEKYFDGAANAKELRSRGSTPVPIKLQWKGDAKEYQVTVRRLPDGKVALAQVVATNCVEVDSLDIGTEWEWTVAASNDCLVSRFKTEDCIPRLVRMTGTSNCRDIGGRRGLGGRRIRQGLVYRTAGLNSNAPMEYYTNEEILDFEKKGELVKMGHPGRELHRRLARGEKLSSHPSRNGLVKRTCFAGLAINKKVFAVFMDGNSYPIVFHCIGGADRTGTVAMFLEALLGVPEDELWRDYLTTGFVGGVSDAKHQQWFGSTLKKLKEYPGATLADKAEAYFLKLGFTKDDVSRLRERLLER